MSSHDTGPPNCNDSSDEAKGGATGVVAADMNERTETRNQPKTSPSEVSPQSPDVRFLSSHNQPGYYAYPTSPGGPVATFGNGGYDIQSFLLSQQQQQHQQQNTIGGGNNTATFGGGRQYSNGNSMPSLSPAIRDVNNGDINLPPPSPLFPGTAQRYKMNSEQHDSAAAAAGMNLASPYLSGPPPSPVMSYGYTQSIPNSPISSWNDRQQMYTTAIPTSPQFQGMPMQYQTGRVNSTRRTGSFDSDLLPPPAMDDSSSAMFTTGGALFSAQQQSWGQNYAQPSPIEIYPNSPLQQHLSQVTSPPRTGGASAGGGHIPGGGINGGTPGVNAGGRHVSINGANHPVAINAHPGLHGPPTPFYPAATPGPPIQTTQNNKGPDGANLFIFHIPNHFTNLDMWHLFCHYGNLLSVRIMVEKDTGRSRGFGFVSYDSPDAAAMAIKELNGFVIGNKRLKVQHKQIRPSANNPGDYEGPPSSGVGEEPLLFLPENEWAGHTTVDQSSSENQQQPQAQNESHQLDLPDVSSNNQLYHQQQQVSASSSDNQNSNAQVVGSTLNDLEAIRDALPDVQ
mmetsp:Transcript_1277/g.1560  ORF Transcript_1277/g.1560 Transcript_1277/m.1560 type:complete len:567 (-) Transcript_1277:183-1883(-)